MLEGETDLWSHIPKYNTFWDFLLENREKGAYDSSSRNKTEAKMEEFMIHSTYYLSENSLLF